MDATELPSAEIRVGVTVGANPLPGAIIEVELPMRRKNSYRFPLGPADENGCLQIAGGELTAWTRKINDLLVMDYVGLSAGWTGQVIVRPVGRAGIRRLRQAHQTWGHTGLYGTDFSAHLDRLEHALVDADGVSVQVAVQPPLDFVTASAPIPA